MATKKEQLTAAKPKKVKALRITCVRDGFWRGGIEWSKTPKTVALDALDNQQLALITGEAKLTVEHVEIEAVPEG